MSGIAGGITPHAKLAPSEIGVRARPITIGRDRGVIFGNGVVVPMLGARSARPLA